MIKASSLKKDFLNAIMSGDLDKAKRLGNLIKLGVGQELPLFITYTEAGGKYILDWKNLSFTKEEMEQLKADVPQKILWGGIEANIPKRNKVYEK